MEKENKIEDCLKVHRRIHFYLIKHEENIFRNDYITNHVHILLSHELYFLCEKTLIQEIDYLKDHLLERKHSKKEFFSWKMSLGLLYLIIGLPKQTGILINENKIRMLYTFNIGNLTLANIKNEENQSKQKHIIKTADLQLYNDDFAMSEHHSKLQYIFSMYSNKSQEEWEEYFKSSKTYSMKPAMLVKRVAEIKFKIKVKKAPKELKNEIEDMVL